jgi:biopolymer transport protein ExbB
MRHARSGDGRRGRAAATAFSSEGFRFVRKLLAFVLLIAPLVANAWWNEEWSFRKEITLDLSIAGANIAGSPADVPVLIRLHLGNFGYFADTAPDGTDLRFIAGDDKTPLKYHIERYDPTNNLAFVWVKVPRLAGGTATEKVYLYYGNKSGPAAADAPGTYDANQVLVYHFAGEGSPQDSTAYGNHASEFSAEANPASLIGGGAKLAGAGTIVAPSSASLRLLPDKGATFSAWIRIDAPQADAHLFEMADANRAFVLGINGTQVFTRISQGGRLGASAQSSDILAAGQWHFVAVTVGGSRAVLYVDGVEVAATPVELAEIAGPLHIGDSAAGGHPFVGELDEVQVSNVVRSADWLQAAARSQGQEAPLVAYGGDAQKEGGEVSYFAITMKNVTVDGWVVIIILAVMFVIALLIIIAKSLYLSRIKKANAAFLEEFERLRGDPTALDRPEPDDAPGDAALDESPFMPHLKGGAAEKFRVSTLYRLYYHGVQEMTGRIGLKSAGARAVTTLTPQAIESIRATMDATQVRLTQKLQVQMVLLTIAISGGPFLGLLGTVVGVMITFAAIAASGDVNVNSIAPGIAAALAATVAGLAVAIPALFGYNWLNTQIKEINADMRVFVDEFVTRIAEHYA